MPWLIVFLAEAKRPDFLQLSPDAAAPMSVALMGSLIVSGGFVQVLARRGRFYLGIAQPHLAGMACFILVFAGLVAAGIVALGGLFVGWYFSLFAWPFLLLGACYFVVATALWMECAILSLDASAWRIPLVFIVGGAAFAGARALGVGTLLAQVIAASTAVLCANAQIPQMFRQGAAEGRWQDLFNTNLAIVVHSLTPYFLYGLLYFTFVMADRISASAAVVALGQGTFGVPRAYKEGMDLALLTFLLAAALIECCNVALMREWQRAGALAYEPEFRTGASQLRRRRNRLIVLLVVGFLAVAYGVRAAAEPLMGRSLNGITESILIAGDLGYLLLTVGLLNGLALLSLNRVECVVRALAVSVAVNFIAGGVLSHLVGAYLATTGLTTGGAVFAVLTGRDVRELLESPDVAYLGA
jgi:hypothetical protein